MRRGRSHLLAILSFGLWLASALTMAQPQPPQQPERRLALLIGNDAYTALQPLRNAVRDVEAVAKRLSDLGFEVTIHRNLNRRDLLRAVQAFERTLTANDLALFYYAGHGMQAREKNYLLPTDAVLETEGDVEASGINLTTVLERLQNSYAQVLLFDACRNNPVVERELTRSGAQRTRGWGRVDEQSMRGATRRSLLVFSTAPEEVALDGDPEGNGPFASAVVRNLGAPGKGLLDSFGAVTADVREKTNQRQSPYMVSMAFDLGLVLVPAARGTQFVDLLVAPNAPIQSPTAATRGRAAGNASASATGRRGAPPPAQTIELAPQMGGLRLGMPGGDLRPEDGWRERIITGASSVVTLREREVVIEDEKWILRSESAAAGPIDGLSLLREFTGPDHLTECEASAARARAALTEAGQPGRLLFYPPKEATPPHHGQWPRVTRRIEWEAAPTEPITGFKASVRTSQIQLREGEAPSCALRIWVGRS